MCPKTDFSFGNKSFLVLLKLMQDKIHIVFFKVYINLKILSWQAFQPFSISPLEENVRYQGKGNGAGDKTDTSAPL